MEFNVNGGAAKNNPHDIVTEFAVGDAKGELDGCLYYNLLPT